MCALKMHNLFYIPPEKISGTSIIIDGDMFHHLKNVLRKKAGSTVFITDGSGNRYTVEIINIAKSRMTVQIVDTTRMERQSNLRCALAFVPLKGARNDYILEKGTELGIDCFYPFISEHAVVQKISYSRAQRFRRVTISAMLQSQQYYTPTIQPLKSIDALANVFPQYDCVFVAHARGHGTIRMNCGSVLLVVGPEGGFDMREISFLEDNGACLLSLGAHRLRSETAAVAGVVKIMTMLNIL
jgi:16S rRNA (uracil1498-N3)-methyltransferase